MSDGLPTRSASYTLHDTIFHDHVDDDDEEEDNDAQLVCFIHITHSIIPVPCLILRLDLFDLIILTSSSFNNLR